MAIMAKRIILEGRMSPHRSSYRGESALKGRARSHDIKTLTGVIGKGYKSKRYLVLAFRSGLDIQGLIDTGVKPQNIVAAERCRPDFKLVVPKFPKVSFWGGDVKDIPTEFGMFDAIMLDMCGPLSDNSDVIIKQLMATRLKRNGVFQFSVQAGRDSGWHNEFMRAYYGNPRPIMEDYGIPMSLRCSFDLEWADNDGRWPAPQLPVLRAVRKYRRTESNLNYLGLTYKLQGKYRPFAYYEKKVLTIV